MGYPCGFLSTVLPYEGDLRFPLAACVFRSSRARAIEMGKGCYTTLCEHTWGTRC